MDSKLIIESRKKKVPKYIFATFCCYLLYFCAAILYLHVNTAWMILPLVSFCAGYAFVIGARDDIKLQAYGMTVLTFINVFGYGIAFQEYTEVFTAFSASVCLISFYHIVNANYLMLLLSTVFVIYGLIFGGGWHDFLSHDTYIATLIRIFSLYVIQVLMILFIRLQNTMQSIVEKKAQEAQEAAAAKEDFLANVSHEIRTPLNAILGMVELALRDDQIVGRQEDYLCEIQSAGEDLLNIIDDILDVTNINAGNLEIVEEDYEITSMVHDVENMIRVMLGEKDVEFTVDLKHSVPAKLRGDGMRIKQIMLNLLGNAVKYTESGFIKLQVYSEKTDEQDDRINLCVKVTDTGAGISKEQMDDLFTEFKQANSRRNRSTGGSGLGLAISKKLIHLMHGEIWAESELGKGSIFCFTVPQTIIDESPCIDDEKIVHAVRREARKNLRSFVAPDARVLIVDDNKVNLKVAEGLLRPYQMHIDTASSGSEAVEMVLSGDYDLIFMDHMMPVMDGVDATKAIRSLNGAYFKEVPIIALSANAVRGARELFLDAGMNDFVAKPIEMKLMDRVLRKWLPEEKVFTNKEQIPANETKGENADDALAPSNWHIEGIDSTIGMGYAGEDVKLYREVFAGFVESVEEKAGVIENSAEAEDFETYTLEVHSLKSTSRAIGAITLSELAMELEECGSRRDIEVIREKTPLLLSMYRKLREDAIANHLVKEDTSPKKAFRTEEAKQLLKALCTCMEEFDSLRGEKIVAVLSQYEMEEKWKLYMNKISVAMYHFDYDVCKETAHKWLEELALE